MEFCERLSLFIDNRKMTKADFAELCEVSKSQLFNYLSGKQEPTLKFFVSLKKRFQEADLNWLISEDEPISSEKSILKAIDANRGTENPDIIFLYGFSQAEVDDLEKLIRKLLFDRTLTLIDARGLKTWGQMLKSITGMEGNIGELYDALKSMLLEDEIMLVLKNLSLSGLPKKDIGMYIRDIFKIMDDAWLRKGDESYVEGKIVHKTPKSALIIMDFPTLLERHHNEIGYYTIPIHPKYDLSAHNFPPRRKVHG